MHNLTTIDLHLGDVYVRANVLIFDLNGGDTGGSVQ